MSVSNFAPNFVGTTACSFSLTKFDFSVLYLLFSDTSSAVSAKIGLFAVSGNFQADEQKTRDIVMNAIEKVNQAGYTEATAELVFPETIVQDVQIIL